MGGEAIVSLQMIKLKPRWGKVLSQGHTAKEQHGASDLGESTWFYMGISFPVGADPSSLTLLLPGELSLPLNVVMLCSMSLGFFRAKSITYSFSVSMAGAVKGVLCCSDFTVPQFPYL